MSSLTEDNLFRAFNAVYESAKTAHNSGAYNKAKRDYYKAAEYMIELSKLAGEKVKAARVDRAKRIMAIADSLPESAPKAAPKKSESSEGGDFKASSIPDVTFNDVMGLEDAKEAVRIKMIYPMQHPEVYKALGKKGGGGILLFGPPGTGKTMLAKAAAHEVGATFYAVKCSDIVSKWVGDSEKNIAALFDTAKKHEKAIIFFDELDSLFQKRGSDVHNDRRVNELLQQIDGFGGQSSGLMILGATNNPWAVDEAAMRPGRFSQKIYIPLPEPYARRAMLEAKLRATQVEGSIDLDALVRATNGFSGADITELIDRATDGPLQRSIGSGIISGLTQADINDALKRVKPSVTPEQIKRFEAYVD